MQFDLSNFHHNLLLHDDDDDDGDVIDFVRRHYFQLKILLNPKKGRLEDDSYIVLLQGIKLNL